MSEADFEQASRVAHAIALGAEGLPPRDYGHLARAYLALRATPPEGEAVAWQKLPHPVEADGWRGDAVVVAFRERLAVRVKQIGDEAARMAGHAAGANVTLHGFDRFLDGLCGAVAGAVLTAHPPRATATEAVAAFLGTVGCGDHSCLFVKPHGMGTNGSCRCSRKPGFAERVARLVAALAPEGR